MDTIMPHDSPKTAPNVFGKGNFCHGSFQSKITAKPVKRAPISEPREENRRQLSRGDSRNISNQFNELSLVKLYKRQV